MGPRSAPVATKRGKGPPSSNAGNVTQRSRRELSEHRGLHAKFPNGERCAACHSEHNGEDFQLIHWVPSLQSFDHDQTGYSLEGKHRGLACAQCRRRIICCSVPLFLLLAGLQIFPVPACAQSNGDSQDVLAKAGSFTQQFVQSFASLRYEEDVTEQKLKKNEKVAYQRRETFDSITRLHFEESGLKVEEQQIREKAPSRYEPRPLLSTFGFSVLTMVFHPYYAASFRFGQAQDSVQDGKTVAEIHFEYLPGNPSPAVYQMANVERPLSLSGNAWIDPATGRILRIEAFAGTELTDLGIKSIHADVQFGPVSLRDETQPQWLPVLATVDLETPRQHWRNIHRFLDYRKYRVTTNLPEAFKP